MNEPTPRRSKSGFRQFFLRGLVVLLPTILTLWIVFYAYRFVDDNIAEPINSGIRYIMIESTPHLITMREAFEPTDDEVDKKIRQLQLENLFRKQPTRDQVRRILRKQNIEEWWSQSYWGAMDLIGIFVAIVIVYFAGRLLGGFVGRRIYRRLERAIISVPVIKQVYPYVKQVVDFLFGEDKRLEFKRVVIVEYPRKGIWSVGLLTGPAMKTMIEAIGDSVTVFIPSSPTPFTGYTITVPRQHVYELPITIDEALRFTISGGVLMPNRQLLPPGVSPEAIQQPSTPVGLKPIGGPSAEPATVASDDTGEEDQDN